MTRKNIRKYYQEPQIYQIKLDLGEAVLSACKAVKNEANPTGSQGNGRCGNNGGCMTSTGS